MTPHEKRLLTATISYERQALMHRIEAASQRTTHSYTSGLVDGLQDAVLMLDRLTLLIEDAEEAKP